MLRVIVILFCCLSATVQAAPKQLSVTYHAVRDGQPFATVTETFQQAKGRYRIESVTEGIGVYALFGRRTLISEGEVTADGLRPQHFEQHQGGNEKKTIKADFNWKTGEISVQAKGKIKTIPLQARTQDILSYGYQFMFSPPKGSAVKLPVTTGRKLGEYHYLVEAREVPIESDAGRFQTVHLVNADKDAEEKKELWIGVRSPQIPVRIAVTDETGARIEQTLTSMHAQ